MKKEYLLRAILVFFLLMTGCAAGPGPNVENSDWASQRELARDLVRRDWDAFMSFSRLNFSDRVSRDFQPDKQSFLNDVENTFFNSTPVDLTFSVDQVLPAGEKLAVTITWQRRMADRNTGALNLSEGECTVVYIEEDAQWRIYRIQGNSIFAL